MLFNLYGWYGNATFKKVRATDDMMKNGTSTNSADPAKQV